MEMQAKIKSEKTLRITKRCPGCKKDLTLNEQNFMRDRYSLYRYSIMCIKCLITETADGVQAKYRYRHIYFEVVEQKEKTDVWACFSFIEGYELGTVKWYPPWRQYCYEPGVGSVLSASCLQDIERFVEVLNELHKQK